MTAELRLWLHVPQSFAKCSMAVKLESLNFATLQVTACWNRYTLYVSSLEMLKGFQRIRSQSLELEALSRRESCLHLFGLSNALLVSHGLCHGDEKTRVSGHGHSMP